MAKDKASQEEIYRLMRADIEKGSYPASSRLPSVRTLAKRFNASPNTISKVVSRLMESGLCNARRGVGLFVRSLPSRKLTLLIGSSDAKPGEDHDGLVERELIERLAADGIEVDRFHVTKDDPAYGPALERIRRPGRVVVCLGLSHEPYLKGVTDLRRPVLSIGHAPNRSSSSSIVPNSFRAGYLAARHLIKHGRRRIAFIGRRRQVRQVYLPEAESLKELAGVQCAFNEEGLVMKPEYIFPDMAAVVERCAELSQAPDAVIMPAAEGVGSIQALKALGSKIDRVIIGDESVLEKPRRPAAVIVRRSECVNFAVAEIKRLFGDDKRANRTYLVDVEFHEALG
ncbi:MAG: GntR family transcriptional regulator [Planctomycetota bacterium]|jgi:DNA-binding GntR family transcriptional regulator